jgi:hypothetical protein
MAIISIEQLEAGMALKANVCDRSGRMLLPAGIELTDKHLKVLRTWGVSEADIVADNEDGSESVAAPVSGDPLVIAAAQEAVDQLFVHNDPQHPLIKELIRICVARKVSHAH